MVTDTVTLLYKSQELIKKSAIYQIYIYAIIYLQELFICYGGPQKGPPHVLAVDLGCGTGQNSRLLAPHFEEVVGMDISETQLNEARVVPGYSNITYR